MEIKTIGATPSKRNQLGNVHTVGWESRSITTQSFISHLVCRKRWSRPFCFVQLQLTRIYIGDPFFFKFRVIDGNYIMKISRSIIKHIKSSNILDKKKVFTNAYRIIGHINFGLSFCVSIFF